MLASLSKYLKLQGRIARELVAILIVDDQDAVRMGVRSLLAQRDDFEICGEAANGRDAIKKATELKPDVTTMDISMPELNGIDATREIVRLLPETKILVVHSGEVAIGRRIWRK